MSSHHSPTVDIQSPSQVESVDIPSKEGTGRFAQEKIMLGLVLVFFGGVLALTVIPAPFTGAAMGIILFLTLVALYRFN